MIKMKQSDVHNKNESKLEETTRRIKSEWKKSKERVRKGATA